MIGTGTEGRVGFHRYWSEVDNVLLIGYCTGVIQRVNAIETDERREGNQIWALCLDLWNVKGEK